jgi:hypothetical protein
MGHLGGGICGFLWGMAFLPRVESPFTKKCSLIGKVGTLCFMVIPIAVLFLSDNISCAASHGCWYDLKYFEN